MEYIRSEHYDHVRNDYGREMVIPSEKEWAEVKQGRWIKASTDGAVFCSECGTEWLSESAKYYKFCPICGARMEASDD